jgi:hypothetical protein
MLDKGKQGKMHGRAAHRSMEAGIILAARTYERGYRCAAPGRGQKIRERTKAGKKVKGRARGDAVGGK